MKVFTPVSQTGGVGKSTYAWGIAWRLAAKHPSKRVLFVDMTKSQGTRSMRVAPEHELNGQGLGKALNAVFSLVMPKIPFSKQMDEIEQGLARAHDIVKESVVKVYGDAQKTLSIDVLPAASARLKVVIEDRWHEPEPGTILGGLLRTLEDDYDYCVIDVTPDIGCKSVLSVMSIADAVLGIQSVVSEDTIQGVAQFLGAVEDTKATFVGFVANLHDPKFRESNNALGVLEAACREGHQTLLKVVKKQGSIANITRVRPTADGQGIMSGPYAEMACEPSTRNTLRKFDETLDELIEVMDQPTVVEVSA